MNVHESVAACGYYRNPPRVTSAYQAAIGMTPGEFRFVVAVLSHEAAYGFSPTREALADFFCVLRANTRRLAIRGLIALDGERVSSTPLLRQTLLD